MARPKGKRINNICKNCNKNFETLPSLKRKFCSNPCAQQYKGKDKSWLEKRKETCLKKYGNEVAFKSKIVQDKYKKNLLEKYGVTNPFLVPEFKNKSDNTIEERYGVKVASSNKDIGEKISKSLKGRVIPRDNFVKIKWEKLLIYKDNTGMVPLFDEQYLLDNKVSAEFDNRFKFKCNKCERVVSVSLTNGYLPSCKCSNFRGYSVIEEEIGKFILKCFPKEEVIFNNRDILPKKYEIDIYVPIKKIAIEVNGVYWHSESMGKYRDYHLYKTIKCDELGVKLIHILDYEWLFKKPIIKSLLLSQLGLIGNKIYARKCEIKEITDTPLLREFLDNNHIQGYTHSKINLGLYYNGDLVSVMTFGKNRFSKNKNEFEMIRFCNILNTLVIGGMSKLFKHFIKYYNLNNTPIISFSDRRFFNGDGYRMLGFEFIKNTPPSYIYFKNYKILNRISCQKHKLNKLLDNFDPNKTEYENMKLNGWKRVWDCGNMKFKWNP